MSSWKDLPDAKSTAASGSWKDLPDVTPAAVESKPDILAPKSQLGTIVRSGVNGASFGFGDEVGGLMGATDEAGRRARTALGMRDESSVPVERNDLSLPAALIARYRRERGDGRNERQEGADENPRLAIGSEIVGGLASPNPFGKAKGIGQIIKTGAKVGGLSALGNSEADLTKGDVGGAVDDAAGGALIGGAVSGVLAPVVKGAEWGAGKLRGLAASVRADKLAEIQAALDAKIASAKGAFGSAVQAGSRTHENVQRVVQGVDAPIGNAVVDPATQRRALGALADPQFRELADKVANNTLDGVGDKLATVDRTKATYEALKAARDPTAAKEFADYFGRSVLSKDIAPRLWRAAGGAAVGGFGGAVLGAPGAIKTQLSGGDGLSEWGHDIKLGAIGGSVMGGAGTKTMMKNLLNSPRAQNAALEGVAEYGSRAVQTPANALTQQASKQALKKPKDQQDEEAIQAWLDGT